MTKIGESRISRQLSVSTVVITGDPRLQPDKQGKNNAYFILILLVRKPGERPYIISFYCRG